MSGSAGKTISTGGVGGLYSASLTLAGVGSFSIRARSSPDTRAIFVPWA